MFGTELHDSDSKPVSWRVAVSYEQQLTLKLIVVQLRQKKQPSLCIKLKIWLKNWKLEGQNGLPLHWVLIFDLSNLCHTCLPFEKRLLFSSNFSDNKKTFQFECQLTHLFFVFKEENIKIINKTNNYWRRILKKKKKNKLQRFLPFSIVIRWHNV